MDGAVFAVGPNISVSLSVNDASDPEVTVVLVCGTEEVSSGTGLASETISISTMYAGAFGSCLLVVQEVEGYQAGNPVEIVLQRQLILQTPTVRSFIGGQEMYVIVNSTTFHSPQSTTFVITCPTSSHDWHAPIGVPISFSLPLEMNGIGCTFTTQNIPAFYLPIVPIRVYIAMSPEQKALVLQNLNPGSFLNYQYKKKLLPRRRRP